MTQKPIEMEAILHHKPTDFERLAYRLWIRDGWAEILAATNNKVKLGWIAEKYEKAYKEKHFSHTWHTS